MRSGRVAAPAERRPACRLQDPPGRQLPVHRPTLKWALVGRLHGRPAGGLDQLQLCSETTNSLSVAYDGNRLILNDLELRQQFPNAADYPAASPTKPFSVDHMLGSSQVFPGRGTGGGRSCATVKEMKTLRAHGFNQRPRFEQVVGYLERNEPLPLDQPDRTSTWTSWRGGTKATAEPASLRTTWQETPRPAHWQATVRARHLLRNICAARPTALRRQRTSRRLAAAQAFRSQQIVGRPSDVERLLDEAGQRVQEVERGAAQGLRRRGCRCRRAGFSGT